MGNLMDQFKKACSKIVHRKSQRDIEEEKLHQREKQMVSEGCPNTTNVILDSQGDSEIDRK